MKKNYLLYSVLAILLGACNQKPDFDVYYYSEDDAKLLAEYLNLPDHPVDYSIDFPQHLSNEGLFARPVEDKKATLGRVLFYDKNLSADGAISCASCHKQDRGFADNVSFSQGVHNQVTARNSFALSSVASFAAYYGTDINGSGALRFFWDNRAETAAAQCRGSLTNPREMNMTMQDVALKVGSLPYYKPLFIKAFNDSRVDEDRVLECLANFVNSIGSYNSKFDQQANNQTVQYVPASNSYVYNEQFSGFTASENRGKAIYNLRCASCHTGNFGRPVLQYANNGLDENTSADQGVGGITGNSYENGCFKVPTLRNIVLTAPYMHDGRFNTLDEVIEHYSSGVKMHQNLNAELRNPQNTTQPVRMNFSEQDKTDLIAFLNTLTDNSVSTAERYSDPFKH